MATKVRVLKFAGYWHWWCPCCMGGDWTVLASVARRRALQHITDMHH